MHAEHSSVYVWNNPDTKKAETHPAGAPVGFIAANGLFLLLGATLHIVPSVGGTITPDLFVRMRETTDRIIRERGAYWTYVFFTGDRYLIGASPERHVSIHDGDVRMNPISGTFRIPREADADAASSASRTARSNTLSIKWKRVLTLVYSCERR